MNTPAISEICLGTSPAELAGLYPWLEAAGLALGMAPDQLRRMHVAVEEAVMNVAMHAYPPDVAGKVWLAIARQGDTVMVRVEDEGQPFDVAAAPVAKAAASVEEAQVGGLGLKLLRHYCPGLTSTRLEGRNRLELPFAAG